jgi:hypothetical protein
VPLNARQHDCCKKNAGDTQQAAMLLSNWTWANALDVRQWLMSAWVTSGRSATPRDARFTPESGHSSQGL